MVTSMRGLNTFITDIRHCQSKDQEQQRCEKELHKIRTKFSSNKNLNGYQKKKYVWKLLYMHVLGYEIDFGQNEASLLINSLKFSEKYTGYIATTLLANENDVELFKTIANGVRNDLSNNNEINQSLALSMIGACAPELLVDQLREDIEQISFTDSVRGSLFVKKKAILCLLRMFRKYPPKFDPSKWLKPVQKMFEVKFMTLGFFSAICSLILGIASTINLEESEDIIVPNIVKMLQKLVLNRDCTEDYKYYGTPNPWLQVKLLKILKLFPPPSNDQVAHTLMDILLKVMKKTEVTKIANKNNSDHSILFEAANLIISYKSKMPVELKNETIQLLGIFITVREPNIRYLALEAMSKFHNTPYGDKVIQDHYQVIIKSLRDQDISIRRRALDILYLMCTPQLASKIVEEILSYVNETDLNFKEELVLKVAILAEKFAADLEWYINVVVKLIEISGEFVSDDIWFRIIQIITGFGEDSNTELQKYAANKFFLVMNIPHVHETIIKIGSYVLAEYSHFLLENGKDPQKIFDVLNRHFNSVSEKGRAMLLNAFAKLGAKYDTIRDQVHAIFQLQGEHFDCDLQQRGVEYMQLIQEEDNVLKKVFEKIPNFTIELQNQNPLLKQLYNLKMGGEKKKKMLDPTVVLETKQQAQVEVDSFKQSQQVAQSVLIHSDVRLATESYIQQLQAHKNFNLCADKIATSAPNILITPEEFQPSKFNNFDSLKSLLTQNNGKIYEDQQMVIQYKSEFDGHTGRIAMQFESKSGSLTDVNFMVGNAQGMLFNITPIKYDTHPQVMLQVLSVDCKQTIPLATVFYKVDEGSNQFKVDFSLPILVNKFIMPVDMPINVFEKNYKEFTQTSSNKFYQIDNFVKNPAPLNVPLIEVMKKVGGLLTHLNFKANATPSMNDIQEISAAAQFYCKNEEGQIQNFPIMIQVQCFEDGPEYLRISLRAGGNAEIITCLYKLLVMYLKA